MAGNNAVAVVRVAPHTLRVAGLLPAGWYPTAVATSANGRTLYIANGKGNGSRPNPDGLYVPNLLTGSVSIVPVPDSAALARYTRAVYALSPYSNPRLRAVTRTGRFPLPLKRVVYIIRENRTYDQVLGDVERGNGDRALAIFNDTITPNAHALARRWVLCSNFYVDGESSADGHEWTDRAFAGDYNEKTWPQINSHRRPWDMTSGEDLVNPRDAYLWDAARKKALWVVNFGELTESGERDPTAATRARTNIPGLKDIASPYARRGIVDSTFYTTSSVVRSIGLILGLAPLSQYAAAATPLWNAFSERRDSTPFTHLPSRWPLDERNQQAFRSTIPDRDFAEADRADEATLNWEIWTSVRPDVIPPPFRRSLVFEGKP